MKLDKIPLILTNILSCTAVLTISLHFQVVENQLLRNQNISNNQARTLKDVSDILDNVKIPEDLNQMVSFNSKDSPPHWSDIVALSEYQATDASQKALLLSKWITLYLTDYNRAFEEVSGQVVAKDEMIERLHKANGIMTNAFNLSQDSNSSLESRIQVLGNAANDSIQNRAATEKLVEQLKANQIDSNINALQNQMAAGRIANALEQDNSVPLYTMPPLQPLFHNYTISTPTGTTSGMIFDY